jgi:urease accessory protein
MHRACDPRMNEADTAVLPALLQLASSALPIGGFGYSSGLEAAIDAGHVADAHDASLWIGAMLTEVWGQGEARHWPRLHRAFDQSDIAAFVDANTLALAMRETAELQLESEQTGRSLALWLLNLAPVRLDPLRRDALQSLRPIAHVAAHAAACAALGLSPALGLHALGWSLIENLSLAAVKLLPLGQDAGQQLLHRLAQKLAQVIDAVLVPDPPPPSNFAPMLAILSSAHETQYSRLFRS